MDESLTLDENAVMGELQRLDLEPNEIPPQLFEGFLERLADSTSLPLTRVRIALQGLIDKGKFDSGSESDEDLAHSAREILRDLILHDPEIQELLKKLIGEVVANNSSGKSP